MLTMSQINHIKDLSNCGYRITEISKKTGADPKTIRKYLAQDDFSPQPPIIQEKPSKLEPFKPIIQEWLDEDKKHWRKQHPSYRSKSLCASCRGTWLYRELQHRPALHEKMPFHPNGEGEPGVDLGSRTGTSRFRRS